MYTVELAKRDGLVLKEAGMPLPCDKLSKYAWNTGGLRPLSTEILESQFAVRVNFRLKRDAIDFAIWAAGWIAAYRKDGVCPLVSPPFRA